MKKHIRYNEKIIDYTIIRSRRKTIGISVSPDKGVRILAPVWASTRQLQDVVSIKAPWIFDKLIHMEEIQALKNSRKFADGESLSFLGKEYKLHVIRQPGVKSVTLDFNNVEFIVGVPSCIPDDEQSESIRNALLEWYKERAAETLAERVNIYSHNLTVKPSWLLVKDQKTRWGSCTRDNKININWKIIMAPQEIVDYLVVHELAHIKVRNHSALYWKLVESILPDCKTRRKWLKQNGHTLGF